MRSNVKCVALVILAAACAGRGPPNTETVPQAHSAALRERAQPERQVSQIGRPPAASAAQPARANADHAEVDVAKGPPHDTPMPNVPLDRTSSNAPRAEVAPVTPESRDAIAQPAQQIGARTANSGAPKPTLGAAIDESEATLRERIQRTLLDDKNLSYTAKHVQIDVAERSVTLRGEVRSTNERSQVAKLVEKMKGVGQVRNALAVINQPPATASPSGNSR